MNDSTTVRVRVQDDGSVVQVMEDGSVIPAIDDSNWERVDAMTEEELDANALSDPDNPPLTKEELAELQLSFEPRDVRGRLKMTQEEFARNFGIPLGTLRDWEQNRSRPSDPARVLLRVIGTHPEVVIETLRVLPLDCPTMPAIPHREPEPPALDL